MTLWVAREFIFFKLYYNPLIIKQRKKCSMIPEVTLQDSQLQRQQRVTKPSPVPKTGVLQKKETCSVVGLAGYVHLVLAGILGRFNALLQD